MPASPPTIRPDKAEDWEPYREIIADMYRTMKLKDVMEEMEKSYGFKGTIRQYKGKIKAWGLDTKYTKTSEYLEVIRHDKERGESPGPARTSSGKQISESSLNRFKKRAEKRGILPSNGSSSSSGHAADQQGYEQGYYEDYYAYDASYQDPAYQYNPQGGGASYGGGQW